MSRDTWNIDYGPLRGLYRDRENAWLFGVCAGIADRFNFNVGAVRVIAAVALVLAFWPTALIYLGASFLIRQKPLVYSGRESEYEFWKKYGRDHWRRS